MVKLKRILFVEDDSKDVELTLTALGENNLANEIIVAYGGVEALDYLYRREKSAERSEGKMNHRQAASRKSSARTPFLSRKSASVGLDTLAGRWHNRNETA